MTDIIGNQWLHVKRRVFAVAVGMTAAIECLDALTVSAQDLEAAYSGDTTVSYIDHGFSDRRATLADIRSLRLFAKSGLCRE